MFFRLQLLGSAAESYILKWQHLHSFEEMETLRDEVCPNANECQRLVLNPLPALCQGFYTTVLFTLSL